METGSENNPPSEIDGLHAELAASAAETAPAVDASTETPDSPVPAIVPATADADFCKTVIGEGCDLYSESVYEEIYSELAPIAGHTIADRIAKRAAIGDPTKKVFVNHGARVLDKYGVAQALSSEAILAGALLLQIRSVSAARKEMRELLGKHGDTAPAPVTGPVTPTPAKSQGERCSICNTKGHSKEDCPFSE